MIFTLSVVAIIYTSLVALMQEDVKKLIAYSSVAHMGFVTMGIFAGTAQGIAGGIFQMISHGIVSGALFLCVGVVYDRMHTREIAFYGGLVNRMPLYAFVFMVFTLANVGLPGTSGFIGEFLSLIGTFRVNVPVATLATIGVILSAAYALWLSARWYSAISSQRLKAFAILAGGDYHFRTFGRSHHLFGVAPKPVLDMSAASVAQLLENYNHAIAAAKTAALRPVSAIPMIQYLQSSGLLPLLPEFVLGIGAMAVLMLGVSIAQSERSSAIVNGFCVLVLALAGCSCCNGPARSRSSVRRQFCRRRLCALS